MKTQAIAAVRQAGSGYIPGRELAGGQAAVLRQAIEHGVLTGTQAALVFAAIIVVFGFGVSLLLPHRRPLDARASSTPEPASH